MQKILKVFIVKNITLWNHRIHGEDIATTDVALSSFFVVLTL